MVLSGSFWFLLVLFFFFLDSKAVFLTTSLSALDAAWRQQLALLRRRLRRSSQAVNAAVNGAAMAVEWERSLVLLRTEHG